MATTVGTPTQDILCHHCGKIWDADVEPWVPQDITCPHCQSGYYLDWDSMYNEETGDAWEGYLLTALE